MIVGNPTPELPVRDVRAAQLYYRDRLGFEVAWHHKEGRIAAVSHGDCTIFFRETEGAIHPATFWMFVEEIDDTFAELLDLGADIVDPIENKPWGLRQFSVQDLNGNIFHFHHDL